MKTSVSELVIEITRKCNMKCTHCLRGDAENVVININHVKKLFSQLESIGSLTITGGEPSLYPQIIIDIIDTAKAHDIDIGNFYIVTNAKVISEQFLIAIIKLWAYCTDNEISSISVSGDAYHNWDTELNTENVEMLQGFSFFNWKDKMGVSYDSRIIDEGRSVDNFPTTREVNFHAFEIDDYGDSYYLSEPLLYLNCEGDLLGACDLSYDSQREKALIITNVQNKNFNLMDSIIEYNTKFDDGSYKTKSEMLEMELVV